jgi:hypothetical protein
VGQRINIQYTVDIDDLENEVQRLMRAVLNDLQDLDSSEIGWDGGASSLMTYNMLHNIDNARQRLMTVDLRLADLHGIIEGYLNFMAKSAEASSTTQDSGPSANEIYTDAAEDESDLLTQRIQKFKKAMEHNDNAAEVYENNNEVTSTTEV